MRRIRTFAVVAAVTVMAATIAPTMMAYATYAKWGANNVSVYVNPANNDVSQNAAIAAVQAGMAAWNTQSGTPFRYWYAGQVNNATTGYHRKERATYQNAAVALATTYYWTSGSSVVDADVVFWDGDRTFFTGSSGCTGGAYIEDVAVHRARTRLGHGTLSRG